MYHLNKKPANLQWLLHVLSTITEGNHLFFQKDYRPPVQRTSNVVEVDNGDGFFSNLPKSKKPRKSAGRALGLLESADARAVRHNQQVVARNEQQLRVAQYRLDQ